MGITDGRKDLDFSQLITCNICGKYGSFHVFMTYTVLSLFFIPCFKWNRRYYVRTSCCNTLYELDPEVGKAIAKGEKPKILPEHLEKINQGRHSFRRCSYCGYETTEDFVYCPKCGNRFDVKEGQWPWETNLGHGSCMEWTGMIQNAFGLSKIQ